MAIHRSIRALSIHAGYACRHSGACCTAGWAIAVEPAAEARIRGALRSGTLAIAGGSADELLRPANALPEGARSLLGLDGHGRCVFFEPGRGNLCAVQRRLGASALPSACRHFPRVCVLTPAGVSITLSHYCPTAAALLFAEGQRPLAVVRDPPAFPAEAEYEGLDARAALPPLLRPGVLMDWESHAAWEEHVVATLGRPELSPEAALSVLRESADAVRAWAPGGGTLRGHVAEVAAASRAAPGPDAETPEFAEALALRAEAARCVPPQLAPPAATRDLEAAHARWVAAAWPRFVQPVRRYLAARAFASWCALQGGGLRTTVRAVAVALGVLKVEAARAAATAERSLDEPLLRDAVRASDLLLVHLVPPQALADRLSAAEDAC